MTEGQTLSHIFFENSDRKWTRILNRRIALLEQSHCLFRMTRSDHFLFHRIAHWATVFLTPPKVTLLPLLRSEHITTRNQLN